MGNSPARPPSLLHGLPRLAQQRSPAGRQSHHQQKLSLKLIPGQQRGCGAILLRAAGLFAHPRPRVGRRRPGLPERLRTRRPCSNLGRISAEPSPQLMANFPYWEAAPDNKSCSYFEKAELARQLGDWEQVARLGDIAFSLDDAPNHPAERTPFIEGYAHTGDWERALQLTARSQEVNPGMQPMLCALWRRIGDQTQPSRERQSALGAVQNMLACTAHKKRPNLEYTAWPCVQLTSRCPSSFLRITKKSISSVWSKNCTPRSKLCLNLSS